MNEFYPTSLAVVPGGGLEIVWNDGMRRRYSVRRLREACPCATCREKRTAAATEPPQLLPVIRPEEIGPLSIARMTPVGNYAYSIAFSDGHDSGIFTLEYLRELGDSPATSPVR